MDNQTPRESGDAPPVWPPDAYQYDPQTGRYIGGEPTPGFQPTPGYSPPPYEPSYPQQPYPQQSYQQQSYPQQPYGQPYPPPQSYPLYGQPVYYQPVYAPAKRENPGQGFGIAAVILGGLSLVAALFMLIVPPILAIIFGAVSMHKSKAAQQSTALGIIGLVLGIVSVLLSVGYVALIVYAILGGLDQYDPLFAFRAGMMI